MAIPSTITPIHHEQAAVVRTVTGGSGVSRAQQLKIALRLLGLRKNHSPEILTTTVNPTRIVSVASHRSAADISRLVAQQSVASLEFNICNSLHNQSAEPRWVNKMNRRAASSSSSACFKNCGPGVVYRRNIPAAIPVGITSAHIAHPASMNPAFSSRIFDNAGPLKPPPKPQMLCLSPQELPIVSAPLLYRNSSPSRTTDIILHPTIPDLTDTAYANKPQDSTDSSRSTSDMDEALSSGDDNNCHDHHRYSIPLPPPLPPPPQQRWSTESVATVSPIDSGGSKPSGPKISSPTKKAGNPRWKSSPPSRKLSPIRKAVTIGRQRNHHLSAGAHLAIPRDKASGSLKPPTSSHSRNQRRSSLTNENKFTISTPIPRHYNNNGSNSNNVERKAVPPRYFSISRESESSSGTCFDDDEPLAVTATQSNKGFEDLLNFPQVYQPSPEPSSSDAAVAATVLTTTSVVHHLIDTTTLHEPTTSSDIPAEYNSVDNTSETVGSRHVTDGSCQPPVTSSPTSPSGLSASSPSQRIVVMESSSLPSSLIPASSERDDTIAAAAAVTAVTAAPSNSDEVAAAPEVKSEEEEEDADVGVDEMLISQSFNESRVKEEEPSATESTVVNRDAASATSIPPASSQDQPPASTSEQSTSSVSEPALIPTDVESPAPLFTNEPAAAGNDPYTTTMAVDPLLQSSVAAATSLPDPTKVFLSRRRGPCVTLTPAEGKTLVDDQTDVIKSPRYHTLSFNKRVSRQNSSSSAIESPKQRTRVIQVCEESEEDFADVVPCHRERLDQINRLRNGRNHHRQTFPLGEKSRKRRRLATTAAAAMTTDSSAVERAIITGHWLAAENEGGLTYHSETCNDAVHGRGQRHNRQQHNALPTVQNGSRDSSRYYHHQRHNYLPPLQNTFEDVLAAPSPRVSSASPGRCRSSCRRRATLLTGIVRMLLQELEVAACSCYESTPDEEYSPMSGATPMFSCEDAFPLLASSTSQFCPTNNDRH